MKANEMTPKAGARLNRIRIVSRTFRILVLLYTLIMLAALAGVASGWVSFLSGQMDIWVSSDRVYGFCPLQICNGLLAAPLIQLGLWAGYGLLLFKLLELYQAGNLFTAKNVFYIKLLGYLIFIDWVMGIIFDSMVDKNQIQVTYPQPLLAIMIVFIAWIMDEGRKIQEEQALTV